jgi:hypothetical protein
MFLKREGGCDDSVTPGNSSSTLEVEVWMSLVTRGCRIYVFSEVTTTCRGLYRFFSVADIKGV